MVRTEPVIKRYIRLSIIALEVAMVELMKIRTTGNIDFAINDYFFKTNVALGWRQRSMLCIHQQVNGMRGDDPVNQQATVVKDVLNWMHG